MKVKTADLSKTLKKYSNQWLALKPKTLSVVASGKEPKKVIAEAKKKGVSHPVLTKAPKSYGAYILLLHEL